MPPFFALSASFTRRFRRLVQPVLALVHPAFCELAGLVLCIVPIPTLSIGHGFGGIPAPCDFGSSAFPFPPKKNLGNNRDVFLCPSRNADPRLGSSPHSLFSAPITRAENGETKSCTKTKSSLSGISARTRSTSPSRRQTASTRFFRWRRSGPGRVPTKNGIPRRSGIASSLYGIKPGCNGSVPGLIKSCAGGSGKNSGHPAAAQGQLSS